MPELILIEDPRTSRGEGSQIKRKKENHIKKKKISGIQRK